MDKKEFRERLGRSIQLEKKDDSWLAHIDKDTLQEDFNVSLNAHITSKDKAVYVYNHISEKRGIEPLRDPTGYMTLDDNVQKRLKQTYRDKYENTLDDIDDNIIDGTGYGVESVLDKLDSTIRKDVKEYLPDDTTYGDLRFIQPTEEHQKSIDKFVNTRMSKTLAYEKKRSYEPEAMERIDNKFKDAGQGLKESLEGSDEQDLAL